ncbi:maleylpyruvate isomerase N-terminal domain-containing protein [Actinoallomurus rhizosphaericola]|uniref:maleylpyruvate isomerase N-terminal domain-containing protein n=1 Tax=Actinoallomurus rhizosphaericola TaxID=2952536 RepID=UPI00209017E1|nr:maleylpyruvate isomerase N-terminal domain-containing protein [Actinoallomurus rhizosphaericola]MCO5994249.1 maleylpyruvate isomerase N-terminal domain-containing protein [Actinoallomurus rhizosphaericola]
MTGTAHDFLAVARSAAGLLRDPAVAARWNGPSALPEFRVSGLAGHLAYQVLAIPRILAQPVPHEPTIPLLEHYARVDWIDAGPDADINVRIRRGGEEAAAGGPEALAAEVDAVVETLTGDLASAPDRPVRIPFWGPWSLTLDDMLISRMMELAVHSDDLAVSVGVPAPALPESAVETVVDLLTRLAVRRHGPTGVLRALSRAERAPASIAAF